MRSRRLGLTVIGGIAATTAFPAHAGLVVDDQPWVTLQISGNLGPHIVTQADVTVRISDNCKDVYQLAPRVLIGMRVHRKIVVGLGVERVYTQQLPTDGHETWTSVEIASPIATIADGALTQRTRLEHRDVEGSREIGYRTRVLLRYVRPFGRRAPTALVLWHESFVGLNRTAWGQPNGYDRIRDAVGLRRTLAPHVAVEGVYLNQYLFRRGQRDEIDHVGQLTLAFAL